jgi:hypothetical protein
VRLRLTKMRNRKRWYMYERNKGEIVGGRGIERGRRGIERECVSVRWGYRKKGRDRESQE